MSDPSKAASRRAQLLENLGTATGTDGWAKSQNPIKSRIGRLEVAWREALQWLMEDIRKMFQNFETVGDAYDIVDVNVASVKSLCIEKGIFTEEEFQKRQKYLFGVLDKERARRQAELEEIAKKQAAAPQAPAEGEVDPELRRMRASAAATKDTDHVPPQATVLGGS